MRGEDIFFVITIKNPPELGGIQANNLITIEYRTHSNICVI